MDNLWQDVRYAVRSLCRQPSFTFVAVGTLAVGIGANTVIYSAVNSTLLHPVPFEGGDRFVRIWHASPAGTIRVYPDPTAVHAWRERAATLDGIATFGSDLKVVRAGEEPQTARVASVSIQLLPFLGVSPLIGRGFVASDTVPGHDRSVLLSEGYWTQQYQRDTDVIGGIVHLDAEPYTIMGVLPRSAQAFYGSRDTENPLDYALWIPGSNLQATVARLKPGVTRNQALAEITSIHAQLEFNTNDAAGWPPEVVSPTEMVSDDLRAGLWILLGTVGFVLLLACVNVANMLLVRGLGRRHELAMRTALGAPRARVLRQLLVEGLLLTSASGIVAMALGVFAIQVITPLLPPSLDALHQVRIDPSVFFLTGAISVVTGLVFGLVPLDQLRQVPLNQLLSHGNRGGVTTRHRSRVQHSLVAVQMALATVLFVGAGLMVKSLNQLSAHDPGFDPTNLIGFSLTLPESRYGADRANQAALFLALLDQLRHAPTVQKAGIGSLRGSAWREGKIVPEGATEPHESHGIQLSHVSDGYFRALSIPIRGRGFTAAEISSPERGPVVVNENFERVFWPGHSAVGKRFRFDRSDRWYTITGVTQNVELSGMHNDPMNLVIYEPFATGPITSASFVVRTTGQPSNVIPELKGLVWQLDADLPLRNIQTAAHTLAQMNARPRFNAVMLTTFAIIGLGLAVVGVYGVVSLALRQRTHELGIRAALGATTSDGIRLMMWHGMLPVMVGLLVGIAGALSLSRFLQSLLFEVEPTDPTTYGLVTVALMIAAFAASYIPARRASRVDPVEVLRVQ